jgi:hypothetical protein
MAALYVNFVTFGKSVRSLVCAVSIQPFRDEISRIIAIYLAEGSPRELNISAKDRTAALRAIAQTTHPSALREIFVNIEGSLRLQSHPNFVRWSICNGNPPRVAFAIFLGIFCIVAGLTASLVLTLGNSARGWRAMGAIGWMLGISTLFAALKGMCIVLHGLHHCHVRPWELWTDAENTEMRGSKESFESGSTSNSYEDEVDRSLIQNISNANLGVLLSPGLTNIANGTLSARSLTRSCGSKNRL